MLFDLDGNGHLVAINEPEPEEPAPRVFIARGRSQIRAWFGPDVSVDVRAGCESAIAELPAWDGRAPDLAVYERIRRLLAGDSTGERVTAGPAFHFGEIADLPGGVDVRLIDEASARLLERHFPYTCAHLALRSPVVGAVVDGHVVAACYSARRRSTAAEAGVDTIEPYRGRGLGPAVVARWARAAADAGMEPLYSTSWDNAASLAVARKLRLVAYADTYAVA